MAAVALCAEKQKPCLKQQGFLKPYRVRVGDSPWWGRQARSVEDLTAAPTRCRRVYQANALTAAARRLLWREALFLWMTFLSATRSMTLLALR